MVRASHPDVLTVSTCENRQVNKCTARQQGNHAIWRDGDEGIVKQKDLKEEGDQADRRGKGRVDAPWVVSSRPSVDTLRCELRSCSLQRVGSLKTGVLPTMATLESVRRGRAGWRGGGLTELSSSLSLGLTVE
jgi:hypothetical protein